MPESHRPDVYESGRSHGYPWSMASLRFAARGVVASRAGRHWHCDFAPAGVRGRRSRSPTCACSTTSAPRSRRSVRSPASPSATRWRPDTLDMVRERLNTTGLFADVNVWWEPHGSGVRVNISVKDKFPWAPVPTASWSSNNKSIGLLFVARQPVRPRQAAAASAAASRRSTRARSSPTATRRCSGPGPTGSCKGVVQRQVIPEYQNSGMTPDWRRPRSPIRTSSAKPSSFRTGSSRPSASPGCAG